MQLKTALTIAGSDSSGGAGIQADIKTMMANGVYAMSAITALTAQNTMGVTGIMEVTPEFLGEQIDAVFTDIRPDAVKIGMVASGSLIEMIASKLRQYEAGCVVLDPVMVATSGARLISGEAVEALKRELFPLATVLTPNIPEAEVISGMEIRSGEDMIRAAQQISRAFHCAVLCKGGHSLNDANDLLYWQEGENHVCKSSQAERGSHACGSNQAEGGSRTASGIGENYRWFYGKHIENPNTHGTGCTLSSAIASNLAKGHRLEAAVQEAKEYVSGALGAMLDLGSGSGPMNHAFAM